MKNLYFLMLFSLIIFSSCQSNYYVSHTQNVALFDTANQVMANVSKNNNVFEFQTAMALNHRFAVGLQGNSFLYEEEMFPYNDMSTYIEMQMGHFKKLNRNWIYEWNILFGNGYIYKKIPQQNSILNGGYFKSNTFNMGFQPAIGYKTKYFQFAFSSKISRVKYFSFDGETEIINQLINNPISYILEPAITIRIGTGNIKFQAQIGKSFNFSNQSYKQGSDYATVGIIGQF